MKTPEFVMFWIASALYLLTLATGLIYAFFPQKRWEHICVWSLRCGFVGHIVTFALRWHYAAHLPVGNAYELNLLGTLLTVFVLLLLQFLTRNRLVYVVAFTALIVAGTMMLGFFLDPAVRPLSAAYDSYWLFVHVFFAWFAFGCFAIATAFAAVYLMKARRPDSLPRFYSLEELDRFTYKLVAMGILFHAVMLVTGAIWARKLWGHYWAWDPLETWALIVFLFYLIYLHAVGFWRLQGKAAAWLLVLGFLLLAISFWGLPLLVPNAHLENPAASFRPK